MNTNHHVIEVVISASLSNFMNTKKIPDRCREKRRRKYYMSVWQKCMAFGSKIWKEQNRMARFRKLRSLFVTRLALIRQQINTTSKLTMNYTRNLIISFMFSLMSKNAILSTSWRGWQHD